jgi:N-acetylneuraminate synthase
MGEQARPKTQELLAVLSSSGVHSGRSLSSSNTALDSTQSMIAKNQQPRTLVIAEAGVNHNGSLERALEMVDVAAKAGADVVKFQTFKAAEVVSRSAPKAEYQQRTTGNVESQLEMARKLELDDAAHQAVFQRCQERGIEFLSSPFDLASLHFLAHGLKIPRIKIASGEITNFPLLLAAARTGKNLILSSGMSTLGEIEAALAVVAFGFLGAEKPMATLRNSGRPSALWRASKLFANGSACYIARPNIRPTSWM